MKVEEIEHQLGRSIPLVYCRKHKTICMPFGGELACCLKAHTRILEEGIKEILKWDYRCFSAQSEELQWFLNARDKLQKLLGEEIKR